MFGRSGIAFGFGHILNDGERKNMGKKKEEKKKKKKLKKLKKVMKKADKKGTKVDRSDIPLNSPTST
jgi:hypothetical protein